MFFFLQKDTLSNKANNGDNMNIYSPNIVAIANQYLSLMNAFLFLANSLYFNKVKKLYISLFKCVLHDDLQQMLTIENSICIKFNFKV